MRMSHPPKTFEHVFKTGFFTCVTSYVIFWGMDLIRPGFVSRTFSVHIFFAVAVFCAIFWLSYHPEPKFSSFLSGISSVLFGVLLAVLVWGFGQGLGEHQIPATVLALFLPSLLFRLIRVS